MKPVGARYLMNSELEAFFTAAQTVPSSPPKDSEARVRERADFPGHFLETVDAVVKPAMDSTAETLGRHGYGATVEVVREQSGSDPNTFPYIILHFSPERCSASELGYIYTLEGASVSFICRRNDLSVEVVTAHPAGRGIERRVSFSLLTLAELGPERITRILTDAVKQIVRL